jgi:hypothetical protein
LKSKGILSLLGGFILAENRRFDRGSDLAFAIAISSAALQSRNVDRH